MCVDDDSVGDDVAALHVVAHLRATRTGCEHELIQTYANSWPC